MSLDHLVLHDGDRVRFSHAEVVSVDGHTWLVRPGWHAYYDPEAWPTPPGEEWAVWVDGVDLDRLAERDATVGRDRGVAALAGRWVAGRLTVDEQGDPTRPADETSLTQPPCPTPAGGWPAGKDPEFEEALRRFEMSTDVVVAGSLFSPAPDRAVAVLAVTDTAAAQAALRPWLGQRVCVVRSRLTSRQLAEARDDLAARMGEWRLESVGRHVNGEGQTMIHAFAERVLPELAAWARSRTEGLLAVDAWLVPDRTAATPA